MLLAHPAQSSLVFLFSICMPKLTFRVVIHTLEKTSASHQLLHDTLAINSSGEGNCKRQRLWGIKYKASGNVQQHLRLLSLLIYFFELTDNSNNMQNYIFS